MAIANTTPPDGAPPPAPQPTKLERALDTGVAALKQAGETAVGDASRLQGIRQAINLTKTQEPNFLVEAVAADAPFLLKTLVAKSISNTKNPGLLDWIPYGSKRTKAEVIILDLKDCVANRNGNKTRTKFQELLVLFIKALCLSVELSPRPTLGEVCEKLKNALKKTSEINNVLNDAVSRVNQACKDVREITNRCSHSSEDMRDEEVIRLCGCFVALGAAMPIVAAELLRLPPSPSPVPDASVAEAPMLVVPNTNAVDRQQEKQHLVTMQQQQSPTTAASSNHTPVTTSPASTNISSSLEFAIVVTTSNSPRGWETESTSPLRQGSPTAVPVSSPVSKAIVPTQAALAAVPSFKYYYDRPSELPKETDRTRMAMFARMINHMQLVPKANLCRYPLGHDAACPLSHSYLDVMRYNPLFKLIVCQQYHHYHGRDVVERNNCGGRHVDMSIHPLDALRQTKNERCVNAESCRNNNCRKSHSFEEVCWYNPWYKTQSCDPTRCRRTAMECPFAHDGELREGKTENDYVGKNVPMLFIERTHQALADKFEALR